MKTEEKNSRPGPKPKTLKTGTIKGFEVGRGDNKHVVPPDQVYELAAIGCTDKEIAAFFSIKEDTLRYNFAEYLQKGREFVKTRLRRNLFRAADNLTPAVLIFLSKNILGMSDTPRDTENTQPLPWQESIDEDVTDDK